jgi:hypothetical protein
MPSADHPKKPYTPPVLVVYGNVRVLTQSGLDSASDDNVITSPRTRTAGSPVM